MRRPLLLHSLAHCLPNPALIPFLPGLVFLRQVHFFPNATEYQLELAANALGRLGGNITDHIPHYGPFGETMFVTLGDEHQPAAEALPGVKRVVYDLPA